ncbi:MAG: hypothetical protein JSU65_07215 [Candidatus Zixiibacteriota bacterium]|nr:MAG: hypothetical protein JSU65_07215 [candidate division Zixibacteria bacterium]
MENSGAGEKRSHTSLLISVLLAVAAIVVLRSAWICDDAWISFRTVDNLVNGHGLTWNVAERVQGFTNPLWTLVMSLLYLFSGELYYTCIALSLIATLVAIGIMMRRVSISPQAAVLGVVILLCSKSFVDYSTSGLENPLTHLLIALFVAVFFSSKGMKERVFWLSLIAALGMFSRLDTSLLYGPALAYAVWQGGLKRQIPYAILGLTPFLLWEMFAIIYYGFPLPNTYYAKLHTGIPFGDMLEQGLLYHVDSLRIDPLTLLVILVSFIVLVHGRKWGQLPLASGIALYLIYILYIGGDFMSGRFFAAPLLMAALLISRCDFSSVRTGIWVPLGIVLLFGLIAPRSPLMAGFSYGAEGEKSISPTGIADERGHYFQNAGLINRIRNQNKEQDEPATEGRSYRTGGEMVRVIGSIGREGFKAGPEVYVIDANGLTDPLLARLPAIQRESWRVGHYVRRIPIGYIETLKTGISQIQDTALAEYYEVLCSITRGEVWSLNRFGDILQMNLGAFDDLLDNYRRPARLLVNYSQIHAVKAPGTVWNAAGNFVIEREGIRIDLDSVCYSPTLEVSVDYNDVYVVEFLLADSVVSEATVRGIRSRGLNVYRVNVNPGARESGYNAIEIRPSDGDGLYSVGHVKLLETPLR